jgi:hypothetical protein
MFRMNVIVIVIVAITFLRLSGRPNMQQIWVITCDLSTNGVMPCHQFLQRNRLCFKTCGEEDGVKGEEDTIGFLCYI